MNPKDSDNHDNPHMKARVQKVYRHFRTATMGGCNGRSTGHDGSLSPIWMFRVLEVLGVFGETVVYLGASDGRVLASALACGADKALDTSFPKIKPASSSLMLSSRGWIRPVAKLIHHITRVELAGFRMTSTGY